MKSFPIKNQLQVKIRYEFNFLWIFCIIAINDAYKTIKQSKIIKR